MKRRLTSALAGIGLGLAVVGPANAGITVFAPLWGLFGFPGVHTGIHFVFDNDRDGFISLGDTILFLGEITRTGGIQGNAFVSGEELTYIAEASVTSAPNGGGDFITAKLGPVSGGILENLGLAAGTTIALWRDPAQNLDVTGGACGTRLECVALASEGELYFSLGFVDPADAGQLIILPPAGTLSIAEIAGTPAVEPVARYEFGVSVMINETGVPLIQNWAFCGICEDSLVGATYSLTALGGSGLNIDEWVARNDLFMALLVPEPTAVALLSVALAGLGLTRRRKLH